MKIRLILFAALFGLSLGGCKKTYCTQCSYQLGGQKTVMPEFCGSDTDVENYEIITRTEVAKTGSAATCTRQ